MKKNRLVLILFVATLGAASATSMAQTTQGPYVNAAGGYTIQYPVHWERQQMESTVVALAPQDSATDRFRENVNVIHEPLTASVTSQQYAAASLPVMQQQLRNFSIVGSGQTTVAGLSASFMVYRHHMMGHDLTVLVYFVTRGNRGYVITCSAAVVDFVRYRPIFEQIVNTLRFQ